MAASLNRCHSIQDLRTAAQHRLPRPIFDYIDGGADGEISLRRNSQAFAETAWLPKVLVDVGRIDTGTRLFGRDLAWPLLLSPTGLNRMFHPEAESAVARAAAAAGLAYALSTVGTTTIEAIGALGIFPKAFQIYVFRDRGLTREFVARCKAARFDALLLTVDTPVAGNRERDLRHGLGLPPRLTLASMASFAAHLDWLLADQRGARFALVNVAGRAGALPKNTTLTQYINSQFDPSVTWKDVEWLAHEWGGPLAIKGIMRAQDALLAAKSGASAVMISNHGGRQLDGTFAPIEQIAPIRAAVGERLEIICDGGVRRGGDIAKALALGANACSIGRAYLYGLAAGGEAGVARALQLLREGLTRTMALAGAPNIAALTPDLLRRGGAQILP